jgi:hypothetical protein
MQHVCWWNTTILKCVSCPSLPLSKLPDPPSFPRPIQFGGAGSGEGQKAFERLGLLLKHLMLRRTKVERADDLGLPPRIVNVRRDYFNEEEEELYTSLFKDVKRKFSTYADEGTVRSALFSRRLLREKPLVLACLELNGPDFSPRFLPFPLAGTQQLLEHLHSHHPHASNGRSPRPGHQVEDRRTRATCRRRPSSRNPHLPSLPRRS